MFPSQLKITALIFIFHILCVCYLCFSIVSLQFDFLHWNDCSTECWLVGLLLWKLMDSFHVVSTCINIIKLMALLCQCLMWIELNCHDQKTCCRYAFMKNDFGLFLQNENIRVIAFIRYLLIVRSMLYKSPLCLLHRSKQK